MNATGRDGTSDAIGALERLFEKQVITQEEGQAAARLITGDASFVFPPAAPSTEGRNGDGEQRPT